MDKVQNVDFHQQLLKTSMTNASLQETKVALLSSTAASPQFAQSLKLKLRKLKEAGASDNQIKQRIIHELLTWQLGPDIVNSSQYNDVLSYIVNEFENDEQCATMISSLSSGD